MVSALICRHTDLSVYSRELPSLEHIIDSFVTIKHLEVEELGSIRGRHCRYVLGAPFAICCRFNADYFGRSLSLLIASRLFCELIIVLVCEDADLERQHARIIGCSQTLIVNDSLLDLYLHGCMLHRAELGTVVTLRLFRKSCLALRKLSLYQ